MFLAAVSNTNSFAPKETALDISPTPQLLHLKNFWDVVCVERTITTHNPELQYYFFDTLDKMSTGDSPAQLARSSSICLRQGGRVSFEIVRTHSRQIAAVETNTDTGALERI